MQPLSEDDKLFLGCKVLEIFLEESRKFEDFIGRVANGIQESWLIDSLEVPGCIVVDQASAGILIKVRAHYLGQRLSCELDDRGLKNDISLIKEGWRYDTIVNFLLGKSDNLRILTIRARREPKKK